MWQNCLSKCALPSVPARGAIYDRNGKLLVYNQPSYDLMVVMNEVIV